MCMKNSEFQSHVHCHTLAFSGILCWWLLIGCCDAGEYSRFACSHLLGPPIQRKEETSMAGHYSSLWNLWGEQKKFSTMSSPPMISSSKTLYVLLYFDVNAPLPLLIIVFLPSYLLIGGHFYNPPLVVVRVHTQIKAITQSLLQNNITYHLSRTKYSQLFYPNCNNCEISTIILRPSCKI